jgi:hypothetical protein
MCVGILRHKLTAVARELIGFVTRSACAPRFCHVDGTFTARPAASPIPTRDACEREVSSVFLARFVRGRSSLAGQVVKAGPGVEALLRPAPAGYQPAGGAFPTSVSASERVA